MQVLVQEQARDLPRASSSTAPKAGPRARRRGQAVILLTRSYERPTSRLQAAVRNAHAMAALMTVQRPSRVRTLVLQEDGTVLAVAALRGTEPATLLRDLLAPLGFCEVQATEAHAAGGYAMILQLSKDAGQMRALHSGGTPVLWPLGT